MVKTCSILGCVTQVSRGGPGGLIVQTGSIASFVCGGFETVESSLYNVRKSFLSEKPKTDKPKMAAFCRFFLYLILVILVLFKKLAHLYLKRFHFVIE
jgi:hypothetical protein